MANHSEVSAIFGVMDKNKDGILSFSDMKQGFEKLGVPIGDDQLKDLMDEVKDYLKLWEKITISEKWDLELLKMTDGIRRVLVSCGVVLGGSTSLLINPPSLPG